MVYKILVLNAGPFGSTMGGALRLSSLFLGRKGVELIWAGPEGAASTENATVLPPLKKSSHRLTEWWRREEYYLKAARENECDAAIFCNAWGTRRARALLKKKGVTVAFDYSDLMHAFHSGLAKLVARKETVRALKDASLTIVTAQALAEDAGQYNKRVELVANGVDLEFYSKARARRLEHPNAGFVGALGAWIDGEALAAASHGLPDNKFYLVGEGPASAWLKSAADKNTVFAGRVSHEEARDYAAGFDVALVPFKKNDLTDAVCPIKLFEYWALGKPVVSSHLREVKRIADDAVAYATTPKEWSDVVGEVLADENLARELAEKGKRLVKNYDWRKLGGDYLTALERAGEK